MDATATSTPSTPPLTRAERCLCLLASAVTLHAHAVRRRAYLHKPAKCIAYVVTSRHDISYMAHVFVSLRHTDRQSLQASIDDTKAARGPTPERQEDSNNSQSQGGSCNKVDWWQERTKYGNSIRLLLQSNERFKAFEIDQCAV